MSEHADTIAGMLDELNLLVYGGNSRLAFEFVELEKLHEQDINANVMPAEMFNALVTNMENQGVVESVPLIANREGSGKLEIVSGHHRIRAAREAGIKHMVVLRYRDLSASEIHAKQLAHNSIAGSSDAQVVKEIFERIATVDLQMEAFIDPKEMMAVPDAASFKPVDIDPLMNSKTVVLVFLDTQTTDFSEAMRLIAPDTDEVYVANKEAFDGFSDALRKVRATMKIKSIPTAVAEMSKIVSDAMNTMRREQKEAETE